MDPQVGPRSIAIPKVELLDYELKCAPRELGGDDSPGPALIVVTRRTWEITIVTTDEATAATIPTGVLGTLSVIREDRSNGAAAGGGAFTLAFADTVACGIKAGGKSGELGKSTILFLAAWTLVNGTWIDPLTVTLQ